MFKIEFRKSDKGFVQKICFMHRFSRNKDFYAVQLKAYLCYTSEDLKVRNMKEIK